MAAVVWMVGCVCIGPKVAIKKDIAAHTRGGTDNVMLKSQPWTHKKFDHEG